MSNFPVGSKIIVTTPWAGETAYKNGDIFTVDAPEGPGVNVKIDGEKQYIASNEFEAYTEPFKIGDAVITTADNEEWTYKAGVEGTVTYIDTDEPKICVSGLGYCFTEDLKLAPAKAEPTPTSHIKVLATQHPREYEVGDILEVSENQSWCGGGEIRVTNKHGNTSVVFQGQWEYVAAPVQVEPERKFKVGDAVVVQANPEWAEEGQTGVIEYVDVEDASLPYYVKGDEGWNFWMREQDLELAKEFTFADIQKGDTIRAEYTEYGVKYIREGIAHLSGGGVWSKYWAAEQGDFVANASWTDATYTLLERTEPPKPNPFAEAKVGSVATSNEGKRYIWVKESEQGWRAYSVGGDYRSSHPTSDEALRADSTMKITYSAP